MRNFSSDTSQARKLSREVFQRFSPIFEKGWKGERGESDTDVSGSTGQTIGSGIRCFVFGGEKWKTARDGKYRLQDVVDVLELR